MPRLSARHGGVFRQPGRAFGGHWPSRTLQPRPLAEQRAIADFLDRKTTAIDALIQKKERLIALLAKHRVV